MAEFLYKELTEALIGAAMEVHKTLGGGFLEAIYQKALAYELRLRKIPFEEQVRMEVYYKGELVGEYIADFLIDGKIQSGRRLEQRTHRPDASLPCRDRKKSWHVTRLWRKIAGVSTPGKVTGKNLSHRFHINTDEE